MESPMWPATRTKRSASDGSTPVPSSVADAALVHEGTHTPPDGANALAAPARKQVGNDSAVEFDDERQRDPLPSAPPTDPGAPRPMEVAGSAAGSSFGPRAGSTDSVALPPQRYSRARQNSHLARDPVAPRLQAMPSQAPQQPHHQRHHHEPYSQYAPQPPPQPSAHMYAQYQQPTSYEYSYNAPPLHAPPMGAHHAPPPAPPSAEAATNIGSRFSVFPDQLLGKGAFGTVYKGYDQHTGRHVAVKQVEINPHSESLLRDLRQEYDLLTRLRHPNIVEVHHLDVQGDKARIVMEWMPSGSVHGIVASTHHRLHENVARRYLKDALKGLAYLHQQAPAVLHRDIKPANMLVTSNGDLKLSDFGTSKSALQNGLSTTQNIVGTPAYMSPESIQGRYSEGSDMWALACSFVHMVSGQAPWAHLGRLDHIPLMFRIGSGHPPNHHPEIPDHLSDAAKDIVRRCFAYDTKERPAAASLLAHPYFTDGELPSTAESITFFHDVKKQELAAQSAAPSVAAQFIRSTYVPKALADNGGDVSYAYAEASSGASLRTTTVESYTSDSGNVPAMGSSHIPHEFRQRLLERAASSDSGTAYAGARDELSSYAVGSWSGGVGTVVASGEEEEAERALSVGDRQASTQYQVRDYVSSE